MSEEEEQQFHDEAVARNGVSLESSDADKYLNSGTAAANCQPRHTQSELKDGQKLAIEEGLEVVMKDREDHPEVHLEDGKSQPLGAKHRRGSSLSDVDSGQHESRKRQHMNQTQAQQQQQTAKKLSYVQMAKLGYQVGMGSDLS